MRTCDLDSGGCGEEKPETSFKVSSKNPNTGKVYINKVCNQCDWKKQQKARKEGKVRKKSEETKLYNEFNRLMRG